jgi:fibronectin type 3 domain-containing protein
VIYVNVTGQQVNVNTPFQFSATTYDQYGNVLYPQPNYVWNVTPTSVGSVTSTGIYSSSVAGTAVVTAIAGAAKGSASITAIQPISPIPVDLAATPSANAVSLVWNAGVSNGYTYYSYDIYRGTASGAEGATPIATVGIGLLTYQDTSVTANTTYYYTVAAVLSTGTSGQSVEVSATPGATVLSAPYLMGGFNPPNVIDLSWYSVSGANSYNIYRGLSSSTIGTAPYATGITSTSFADQSVTANTQYYYEASAVNSTGNGLLSNIVSSRPGTAYPPEDPATLTAALSGSTIILNWTESVDGTGYNIYRGTSSGAEGTVPYATVGSASTNTFTDTSVLPVTSYYYIVSAIPTSAEYKPSNEAGCFTGGTPTHGFILVPSTYNVTYGVTNGVVPIQIIGAPDFSGSVTLTVSGTSWPLMAFCYGTSVIVDPTTHYGEGANLWLLTEAGPSALESACPVTVTGTAGSSPNYPNGYTYSTTVNYLY